MYEPEIDDQAYTRPEPEKRLPASRAVSFFCIVSSRVCFPLHTCFARLVLPGHGSDTTADFLSCVAMPAPECMRLSVLRNALDLYVCICVRRSGNGRSSEGRESSFSMPHCTPRERAVLLALQVSIPRP